MTSRRGFPRVALVVAASVALVLFPAAVLAHAELVRAIPADGATVTEPVSAISGRYSEDLAEGSSLKVIDAGGVMVASGAIDPNDPRLMIARPETPLTDGTFSVRSTAIAADGHVERADWTFSVEVAATSEPTPIATDPASPPATTSPTPASTPSPAQSASPTPSAAPGTPTSSDSDVLLPIIAALAIVLVGVGFLLSRSRAGR